MRNNCSLMAGREQYSGGQGTKAPGARNKNQSPRKLLPKLPHSNRGRNSLSTPAAGGGGGAEPIHEVEFDEKALRVFADAAAALMVSEVGLLFLGESEPGGWFVC